jgi:GMP synthase-like glutamine amidotransferase
MILIIENDPDVPPGILTRLIQDEARICHVCRPYAGEHWGDLSSICAIVVLGGAMSSCDTDRFPFLIEVKRLMERAIRADLPLLGICLGGQLLADVAGGKVLHKRCGEHGMHEVSLTREGRRDTLFSNLPERFAVFQWHDDSFLLPENAVLLAGSVQCPHQAFRLGTQIYGVQFHPEVDDPIVANWSADNPSATEYREDFARHGLSGPDVPSAMLLRNFIRMVPRF